MTNVEQYRQSLADQQCMRHSQLATTAHYVGVSEADLHAAAESLPWAA